MTSIQAYTTIEYKNAIRNISQNIASLVNEPENVTLYWNRILQEVRLQFICLLSIELHLRSTNSDIKEPEPQQRQ